MKAKETSITPLQPSFKFDLAGRTPDISEFGNTIRMANQNDFGALSGNAVAFFMIDMKPGALRVPHWHPNAWELDYCLAGEARFWITGPDDVGNTVKQIVDIQPGQLMFIPQGWFHAIKCVSSTDLQLLLTFNNGLPTDIGIPVGLNGMGNEIFAQTFGVSPDVFNNFNENNTFFAPPAPWEKTGKRKSK